jgi:hypothetical protein
MISKSTKSLLEALLHSNICSLQLLAKECGAHGVSGICALLKKEADGKVQVNNVSKLHHSCSQLDSWILHISNDMQQEHDFADYLTSINADDEDTIYVGKCVEDV